jgi:hypothetical protein
MIGIYLSGYQSYKLFMAINLHFNQEKYDIFEMKGRTKINENSFTKRNDKHFFTTLGREYKRGDLGDYYMANIMAGCTHISQYTDYNLREWKSKMHRIDYIFEEDLKKLSFLVVKHEIKFNDLFSSITGNLPLVVQLLNGGHINLETICIIDKILGGGILLRFDEQIRDKFVWPKLRMRIHKYSRWLNKLELSTLRKTLINYTKQEK